MKSRNEVRKPTKEIFGASDDLRKSRKLKPLKKEKNVKRSLFREIDDLEDVDLDYHMDDDETLEDYFDDDEE